MVIIFHLHHHLSSYLLPQWHLQQCIQLQNIPTCICIPCTCIHIPHHNKPHKHRREMSSLLKQSNKYAPFLPIQPCSCLPSIACILTGSSHPGNKTKQTQQNKYHIHHTTHLMHTAPVSPTPPDDQQALSPPIRFSSVYSEGCTHTPEEVQIYKSRNKQNTSASWQLMALLRGATLQPACQSSVSCTLALHIA